MGIVAVREKYKTIQKRLLSLGVISILLSCSCTKISCLPKKTTVDQENDNSRSSEIVFLGFELRTPRVGGMHAFLAKKRVVPGFLKQRWPKQNDKPNHGDLRLLTFDAKNRVLHQQFHQNPMHSHCESVDHNHQLECSFRKESISNSWFRFQKPSRAEYGVLEYFDSATNNYVELLSFDLIDDYGSNTFAFLSSDSCSADLGKAI